MGKLLSRSLRCKILYFLSFIPGIQMVKLQYRMKTGEVLNLKNPKFHREIAVLQIVLSRFGHEAMCG